MQASLLLYAPLVFVNVWHAIVILLARKMKRPWGSISESAVASSTLLTVHKAIHVIGAICFFMYGLWLFSTQAMPLVAAVLCITSLFDCVQVMALNARTDHTPLNIRDHHQLLAWLMAISDLAFCILFAVGKQVALPILFAFLCILGITTLWLKVTKFRYFWLAQMIFFVSGSVMIVIAARHGV